MSGDGLEQRESRESLGSALLERIESFQFRLEPVSVGTVVEVGDGIVRLSGLRHVMMGEMVHFDGNVLGMVLNLEADNVGVIVLGDHSIIREESTVEATGRVMSVPVGNELIGRVVDPIGAPIDERGAIASSHYRPVERVAPGIIQRQAINTPLQTGIKAVDALVPIGRGQRELIVGDRQTGKTTLAIDTILNQHRDDVLCVYVAIGQKLSSVAQVVHLLRNEGAMDHTVVVAAEASAPVALQYIAPYTGCAIAEEFMEQGRDVLIIYDDLTKHAWAYRQISLLLRRPPGREAYPGDIFYLHSRLLERAGRLSKEYNGGSMTALPIIETQMGDMAAYIPTNVISITDGQIYLEAELFHSGVRPAVNAGLSVSRVAGAAQYPIVRSVAGQMRLELAQYRELAAFARFGTELDRSTQRTLDRGARLMEMLKQRPHQLVAVEDQVVLFYAAANGYLDEVPVEAVDRFERQLVRYLHERRQGLRNAIAIQRELSPSLEQMLRETIREFLEQEFDAEREA